MNYTFTRQINYMIATLYFYVGNVLLFHKRLHMINLIKNISCPVVTPFVTRMSCL